MPATSRVLPDDEAGEVYWMPMNLNSIRETMGMGYRIKIKDMLRDLTPHDARRVAEIAAEYVNEHA